MIALSFDIEEFDVPLENNIPIEFEEQLRVSTAGVIRILEILKRNKIRATFFCTVNYAVNKPDIVKQIIDEGHEIASHGMYHSKFEVAHLLKSKEELEKLTNQKIYGYRMARMMPVEEDEVRKAGYRYNASLNPTFIPGRYNNLRSNPYIHKRSGILELPSSVSPVLRLPLFWLAIHNYPMFLYKYLIHKTIKKCGYLIVYMHPWEFYELKEIKKKYSLSPLMVHNSGKKLEIRLQQAISFLSQSGNKFITMNELAEWHNNCD